MESCEHWVAPCILTCNTINNENESIIINDKEIKKVENVEKPAPQVDTDGELNNKKDKEKEEIEEKKEQPKKRAGRPAKK